MKKFCFITGIILLLILPGCSSVDISVNNGYGEYLIVPAGEFLMGDNFDEGNSDEIPVHKVYLDAYYIGQNKITNYEYNRFISDNGYTTEIYWEAGEFGEHGSEPDFWRNFEYRGGGVSGNDNYPVVGVSWFEAMAYCSWLSVKTGYTYRLPTEAEWEKAARGTTQYRFPWGNEIDETYARYDYGGSRKSYSIAPVGYYNGMAYGRLITKNNASPFGAYDMAGNISEWCLDWYDHKYYRASPETDPKGPDSGSSRVLRCGGYVDSAYYQRAASRHKMGAHFKSYKTGFRCVREIK
ncbi:MAG: formylglycine-generating enzyme family protein [bacterium]|nr:formylglycine-generating enzyme family protein [bacterium]